MTDQGENSHSERREFISTMTKQRKLLVLTVRGLSEEQIRLRPTPSALCLGGLLTHVTMVEQSWSNFIVQGSSAIGGADPTSLPHHDASFEMTDGETLVVLLERYDQAARSTNELVMALPSLDLSHPLPEAPWFKEGASWSARRVLLHIIAETAQHAGHADIIREAIDGAKTMG
ncbi:MAG TPA: DinB family protein [Acidimicrobiales bacterium]|jgi:uncharacterized damage-inducible protein DinB|nr:DinB family protein [Acidimicrobiales bacterium]